MQVKVLIAATVGSGDRGDIAIDDVAITRRACGKSNLRYAVKKKSFLTHSTE